MYDRSGWVVGKVDEKGAFTGDYNNLDKDQSDWKMIHVTS